MQRFGLSSAARSAIMSQLKTEKLAHERFSFEDGEFQSVLAFKSIELSNGGTLTAPSSNFDDVFHQERVDGVGVRFVTEGKIINEKLKPTR